MARITIAGDAIVVTSAIKTEVLVKLAKFKPKALKLFDTENKKDELYAVSTGKDPSFTKFGATYSGTNADGFATATLPLPTGLEDKATFVKDTYGYALLSLNTLEGQIENAADGMAADFDTIDSNVSEVNV